MFELVFFSTILVRSIIFIIYFIDCWAELNELTIVFFNHIDDARVNDFPSTRFKL